MMPIGGYFELELDRGQQSYHSTPYTFKSGRSSLRYILEVVRPSLVYIPFYTCDALIASFQATGIAYKFYEVDHAMEPKHFPILMEGELFLYVNYFDVKRNVIHQLSMEYGEQLIVDCSQAFFMKGNGRSWFFNSCRKFFGVPDGSYLYAPDGMDLLQPTTRNEDYFFEHLLKRFNGDPGAGYNTFIKNEIACGPELKAMSKLSEYLLSHVDFEKVIQKRRSNFNYLHQALGQWNHLKLELEDQPVPMCYPYLPGSVINKNILYANRIYIPSYWLDVINRNYTAYRLEKELAGKLVPLPVDHRYQIEDMEKLLKQIKHNHELFCLSKTS